MNTETIPATGAAGETTAPELVETQEVTIPEPGSETQQAEPTDKDPVKSLEERLERERQRFERRYNRKHGETAQLAERLRLAEERLQRFEQPSTDGEQPKTQEPQVDPYRLADEIATARSITEKSNAAFSEGMKSFGDAFRQSVAAVIDEAGDLIDKRGLPTALGEAVLDSDKPAELLHYLGQNPDIAESLNGLSPARLGRRIEAIERDMKTAKVSKAPAPLTPVTAKGAPVAKSESAMTDAEWYAARRKRS